VNGVEGQQVARDGCRHLLGSFVEDGAARINSGATPANVDREALTKLADKLVELLYRRMLTAQEGAIPDARLNRGDPESEEDRNGGDGKDRCTR
jgi:hypothetical protein